MSDDRERDVARAQEAAQAAKSLLENKTFAAVLDALEAQYLDQMRHAEPNSPALHEGHAMCRALDHVRRDLKALVDGGSIAAYNARNVFKR